MGGPHFLKLLIRAGGYDPLEDAFLRAIVEDPEDESARCAYADWLEENGQGAMAAYLRLEIERGRTQRSEVRFEELTREMAAAGEGVDLTWRLGMDRPGRILNCDRSGTMGRWGRFAFRCPNRWPDLSTTSDPGVRHCGDCNRDVSLCQDIAEAKRLAEEGACIAISSRVALGVLAELEGSGLPEPPAPPPVKQKKPWWQFW